MMKWEIKHALTALASPDCHKCNGTGEQWGHESAGVLACNCVLRAIFRVCWARQYFYPGAVRKLVAVEYAADLVLSARRELGGLDWQIFKLHFVERRQGPECCRRLRVNRGTFYHRMYRVEELLGNAWVKVRPYALYPPDEYFNGAPRRVSAPARGVAA